MNIIYLLIAALIVICCSCTSLLRTSSTKLTRCVHGYGCVLDTVVSYYYVYRTKPERELAASHGDYESSELKCFVQGYMAVLHNNDDSSRRDEMFVASSSYAITRWAQVAPYAGPNSYVAFRAQPKSYDSVVAMIDSINTISGVRLNVVGTDSIEYRVDKIQSENESIYVGYWCFGRSRKAKLDSIIECFKQSVSVITHK